MQQIETEPMGRFYFNLELHYFLLFNESRGVYSDWPYAHRENLRRHFGLVLRNAEHVDSAEPLERGDYRSSRGHMAGSDLKFFGEFGILSG